MKWIFQIIALFALCLPVTAQTADAFIDFEQCSAGVIMTTTCLGNSTHGGNGSWSNGSQAQLTAATVGQLSNLIAPITVSATTYPGTGILGAQYTGSSTGEQQNLYIFTPPGNSVAVGFWIQWDIPNADAGTYDLFELACTGTCGGSRFAIPNVTGGMLELEDQPCGNSSSKFATNPGTLYYMELSLNAGTNVTDPLNVYDQFGTLLATLPSSSVSCTNTHPANYIAIGSAGDSPQTNGIHWWTDNIVLNYTTGTLPVDLIIPGHSGSSPTWITTPDRTSVASVVSSASTGDTINVSAGIADWASAITWSSKNLIIKGAGPVNPTGTVNTQNGSSGSCSADCVLWYSGNQFATSWTGGLTIGGTPYTISTCYSATLCRLTSAPGTQTNVVYVTNQSGTEIGNNSLQAATCNYPCRLSGFTWDLNGTAGDYMQITQSLGWEVDNNYFNVIGTADTMLFTYGIGASATEGLFHHNASTNGQLVTFGESTATGGQYRWAEAENAGTQHAVYAEDNYINNLDGSEGGAFQAFTECNYGGSTVTRFNTMLGGRVSSHGLQGESQDGCKHFEFYNNTFTQPGTPNAETLRVRGGTGFIFHNTSDGNESSKQVDIDVPRAMEDSIASQLGSTLWWEFCDGLTTSSYLTTPGNIGGGYTTYGTAKSVIIDGAGTGGYPCRDGLGEGNNPTQWTYSGTPPVQPLVPAYIWRNTESASEIPVILVCETSGDNLCTNQSSNIVIQNRDWYGYNAANNGTVGVGEGPIASRPLTCTAGVGYWATDQGSWNTLVAANTSGELYECTSTNTWTLSYTPYTYPYSFTSAAAAPTCDHTTGSYSFPFTNTCSTVSTGTVILCWATGATLPVTNGAGTGCNTGTSMASGGSTTISSSETFNIVAGTSTLSDSPETTYIYSGSSGASSQLSGVQIHGGVWQ